MAFYGSLVGFSFAFLGAKVQIISRLSKYRVYFLCSLCDKSGFIARVRVKGLIILPFSLACLVSFPKYPKGNTPLCLILTAKYIRLSLLAQKPI